MESLRSQYAELLGPPRPGVLEAMEKSLNQLFGGAPWSVIGYLTYVLEQKGDLVRYPNVQLSNTLMQEYRNTSKEYRELIPVLMTNTFNRLTKLMEGQDGSNLQKYCELIDDSAHPLVLYLLFKVMAVRMPGTFLDDLVRKHEASSRDFLRKYPEAILDLNEPYKALAEELNHATSGEGSSSASA